MSDTAARLRGRAQANGLTIPARTEAQLVAYFDLLYRWNAKINLTSLADSDAAIDRLLLEPVAAALELPHHLDLMDLGSGGGSPAIPLAIVLEARRLIMVESKNRKAAFLREAVRVVELSAVVEADRFEIVADRGTYRGQMAVVSIRGVKLDAGTLATAKTFLKPGGCVALFTSVSALPPDFLDEVLSVEKIVGLPGSAHLVLLKG